MADEQVRIDLTANDKASRTIDQVADDVERLEQLDPEITIGADDDASKTIADVRDDAEQLERLDPEVHITADDDASRTIGDVRDDAERLTRADHELILKARIDDARAGLKALRDDLDQTADEARKTEQKLDDIGRSSGPGLAGNAVADLTGPLGEASSAASDIAGVFDGLGDITGAAAARVGIDAEKMAGAITGIGFAVTAAVTAWTYFRQKQEAARQKQEELTRAQRDFNKALREGDLEDAGRQLVETYKDAYDAARRAGVGASEFTRYLTGQTDTLGDAEQRLADVNARLDDMARLTDQDRMELIKQRGELTSQINAMRDAHDAYTDANGSLEDQDRQLRDVTGALRGAEGQTRQFAAAQDRAAAAVETTRGELDKMRGALDMEQALLDWQDAFARAVNTNDQTMAEQQADVIAMKQAIIDAGEAVGKSPWQIQTELNKVDDGDLYAVKADVENWYRMHPVIVASKLDRPGQIFVPGSGGSSPTATAAPMTVNMHLPAGWRGDPLAAARQTRRRAGRYYARI